MNLFLVSGCSQDVYRALQNVYESFCFKVEKRIGKPLDNVFSTLYFLGIKRVNGHFDKMYSAMKSVSKNARPDLVLSFTAIVYM